MTRNTNQSHRSSSSTKQLSETRTPSYDDSRDGDGDEDAESGETRAFAKHAEFKTTDSQRRIAVGAALVPDEVDLQGDWIRSSVIEATADEYMSGLATGESLHGVMHAKFPGDEDITLVENRVLDADETIGEHEFAAGTWIIGYKIHDDALFSLIDDGVLTGFSIGGKITEAIEMSVDEAPAELSVPEYHPSDEPVSEIRDATVREVSLVDLPAVPNAQVAAVKTVLSKSDQDALTDPEQAQALLEERGHSAGDAARLANYLLKSDDADEAADGPAGGDADATVELDDDAKSLWQRFTDFLKVESGSTTETTSESPTDDSTDESTEKVGSTLSESSRQAAFAAHDAIETLLASDNSDYETNRQTDNPDSAFDIGYYTGKSEGLSDDLNDVLASAESELQSIEISTTTDTSMSTETDETTDEQTPAEKADPSDEDTDAPQWADDLVERVETNAEAIDDLADDKADKTDEKAEDEDAEGTEAPAWAKALLERTEQNSKAIDAIGKQGGHSQQLHDLDDDEADKAQEELAKLENEVFSK